MRYLVELSKRAFRDLEQLYLEKNAADSVAAAKWFNRLEDAVYSLEELPRRGVAAPEAKTLKRELFQLHYGKKPHVYRIIYEIEEHRKRVQILTIRHGAREPLELNDPF